MTEPIQAKVSEEDFNKVMDAIKEKELTHEEMLEEAERREKINAGFKQDADGNWYRPTPEELSEDE